MKLRVLRLQLLFTVATWKQPKRPSADEWIKKISVGVYVHLYSGILLTPVTNSICSLLNREI